MYVYNLSVRYCSFLQRYWHVNVSMSRHPWWVYFTFYPPPPSRKIWPSGLGKQFSYILSENNLNLRIKIEPFTAGGMQCLTRPSLGMLGFYSIYIYRVPYVSGSETRHLPLSPRHPWQARFSCGELLQVIFGTIVHNVHWYGNKIASV